MPLSEQTLANGERVLRPDHPNPLITRRNLANARRGRRKAAEPHRMSLTKPADHQRTHGRR